MTVQPFASFYALRSLAPNVSEIHLVGGAIDTDAAMIELTTLVRSRLGALGEGQFQLTAIGEKEHWRGICVAVDDALFDTISRQVCPRLHDTLAGWVRDLCPGVDVVWRPR